MARRGTAGTEGGGAGDDSEGYTEPMLLSGPGFPGKEEGRLSEAH